MSLMTRRAFTQASLSSLLTASLLQTLFEHEALADSVKPITEKWLKDLSALCLDLEKGKGDVKVSQLDWQKKVEELFGKVEMSEMLKLIDFPKLTEKLELSDKGEKSLRIVFPKIEGLTNDLGFGRQVFAVKKDRSVVPHGHNNMATAFLVLKGEFHGKHYDRIEDTATHMIVRPTIDRNFGAGTASSISDYKDNVHWFKAVSDAAFIFNIHVNDINPTSGKETGRVYIDPNGEKLSGGLVRAKLINHDEVYKLYG